MTSAIGRATPVFTKYLRDLGFKSLAFSAKFSGGKCGICQQKIHKHGSVVYFRDNDLCHEACTTRVISTERLEADPTTAALRRDLEQLRKERAV